MDPAEIDIHQSTSFASACAIEFWALAAFIMYSRGLFQELQTEIALGFSHSKQYIQLTVSLNIPLREHR